MSRIHVITGSASGIGAATAERLLANGHKVIGVDIQNADVTADLSTPTGRNDAIEQVKALAPDGIDGILTSAGSANFDNLDVLVATNYFGTTKFFEGLHPIIRKPGGRCVTVSSAALLQADNESLTLQEACLADDEDTAVDIAKNNGFFVAYSGAKRALASWSRRTAITPEWAGSGILLNVVAPGIVMTPMTMESLSNSAQNESIKKFAPIACSDYSEASDQAELIDFLLNCETNHLVGQVIFMDGGTEAILGEKNQ